MALKLTLSGAGWVAGPLQSLNASIYALLGVADASAALNAVVYVSETPPPASISAAPADAQDIATLKTAQATSLPVLLEGEPVGAAYVYVNFVDAGTGHALYVYSR